MKKNINILTEKQEKELGTLVPQKIKAILAETEKYTEITSEWYVERTGYILSLLEESKPSEQLSMDIETRLKTIKRYQETRKVDLEAAEDDVEIDVEEITIDALSDIIAKHIIYVNVERAINSKEIEVARAQGDLSENAEYDAARDRQAEIEKTIQEFAHIFEKAQIIDLSKVSTKEVAVGTKVTYTRGKESFTYKIIGSSQANPEEGIISKDCEVAKALLGKKEGEETSVRIKKQYDAGKPYKIKIVKIEKADK